MVIAETNFNDDIPMTNIMKSNTYSEQEKQKVGLDVFEALGMFSIGMLFILAILMIIYFKGVIPNTIKPQNCNAPTSGYSVNPKTTATSNNRVISVTGLDDAINRCTADGGCKSFVYDEQAKSMQVVDLSAPKSKSSSKDLYTLQNGVTFTT